MTDAVAVLAELRRRGVVIRAEGDRLRYRPKDVVPPALLEQMAAHKAGLVALLKPPPPPAPTAALRAAYRRWFELTVAEADGQRINPAKAEALHQAIVRLTDEAGPRWADGVYADELRRFRWDTARCGACGGLGHDSPHESET